MRPGRLDGRGPAPILWNDQRTAAECDAIRELVGRPRLIAITGNDAVPGFTAPKLLWLRRHEPEVWAAIAHVLLPKDFVRLRLTGEHAVDRADGSGTMLFDLAARDWSTEISTSRDQRLVPRPSRGRPSRGRSPRPPPRRPDCVRGPS
jgi:xylulokinase